MIKQKLREEIDNLWPGLTVIQKVIILILYKVCPYEIDISTLTEIVMTDYHLITEDKIDDLKNLYFEGI